MRYDELTTAFLTGKSAYGLGLFDDFLAACRQLAPVSLYPAKSMIGIKKDGRNHTQVR